MFACEQPPLHVLGVGFSFCELSMFVCVGVSVHQCVSALVFFRSVRAVVCQCDCVVCVYMCVRACRVCGVEWCGVVLCGAVLCSVCSVWVCVCVCVYMCVFCVFCVCARLSMYVCLLGASENCVTI